MTANLDEDEGQGDEGDEENDEVDCICMQPWGDRLVKSNYGRTN